MVRTVMPLVPPPEACRKIKYWANLKSNLKNSSYMSDIVDIYK